MTSIGATSIVQESGFVHTFKVQGQIYLRIGSLLPCPNESQKFLQIYFMGEEQLQIEGLDISYIHKYNNKKTLLYHTTNL